MLIAPQRRQGRSMRQENRRTPHHSLIDDSIKEMIPELLRAVARMVVQEILVDGFTPAESFFHPVPKLDCRLAQLPPRSTWANAGTPMNVAASNRKAVFFMTSHHFDEHGVGSHFEPSDSLRKLGLVM